MSLTSALNSALSGLKAASRGSLTVSENVANALTPSYGKRMLELTSPGGMGSGVRVSGVTREVDPAVIADRRLADAGAGGARTLADFHARLERLVGLPGEDGSLPDMMSAFQTRLAEAASRPDVTLRLDAAVQAGADLADGIRRVARGLNELRAEADGEIARQVERLNGALQEVEALNRRITTARARGEPTAGFEDQRQALIDEVSAIVPVREVGRDGGAVSLYSTGGAILLDLTAAKVEFTAVSAMDPGKTLSNGALSGLSIDGIDIPTDAQGPLSGGTLGALFEVRDEAAVAAQSDLDAFARDLVERFAEPALDTTRAPGDPGLFTDAGAAFDPADGLGLSGRIEINAAVDRSAGGAGWRLRDGLGAAAPGDPGNAALLNDLSAALTAPRVPGGRLGGTALTAAGLVGALASRAGSDLASAERALSLAAGQQTELQRLEREGGVDTDSELQTLMQMERLYAANARVLQSVDAMMETLERL